MSSNRPYDIWSKLSSEEQRLYEIVHYWHADQRRKYTDAPYVHHILAVADILIENGPVEGQVAIALCHDLLEDTKFERDWLQPTLQAIGYSKDMAIFIDDGVFALTDQFTHPQFPGMNRQARKEAEADRLGHILPEYQTVKYADIIDNTSSIVPQDPGFAKIYMVEIRRALRNMRHGRPELLQQCDKLVNDFFEASTV